jgi:hypothetical protein
MNKKITFPKIKRLKTDKKCTVLKIKIQKQKRQKDLKIETVVDRGVDLP